MLWLIDLALLAVFGRLAGCLFGDPIGLFLREFLLIDLLHSFGLESHEFPLLTCRERILGLTVALRLVLLVLRHTVATAVM